MVDANQIPQGSEQSSLTNLRFDDLIIIGPKCENIAYSLYFYAVISNDQSYFPH